jgi:hypothetical protein
MAIPLPTLFFDQAVNVGRSYYENLAGGTTATVLINNNSAFPLTAVFTVVGSPALSFNVPAMSSFGIGLSGLLVVAILSAAGAVNGEIFVTVSDF